MIPSGGARRLVVATAQCRIDPDPSRNAATIRRIVKHAAARGARLVHLPEGALSGYAKAQIPSWDAVDFDAVRRALQRIAEDAQRLGLWVVVGSAHPLTPPNRPHNALYVIADDGRIAGRYDKRLCSNSEINDWYTPGFEPYVFEVDGVRVGCALCIEIRFPEIFLEAAHLGVEVMLVSSYSDDPIDPLLARAHAAMNTLWVSYCVPANTSGAGASRMVGPDGHELARCAATRPQTIVTAVDPGDAKWEIPLRRAKPWRAAARDDRIYETKRVDDPRSRDKTAT